MYNERVIIVPVGRSYVYSNIYIYNIYMYIYIYTYLDKHLQDIECTRIQFTQWFGKFVYIEYVQNKSLGDRARVNFR